MFSDFLALVARVFKRKLGYSLRVKRSIFKKSMTNLKKKPTFSEITFKATKKFRMLHLVMYSA